MLKLKAILGSIFGDKENVESERYFLTMISFTSSIFVAILCVFHLIEHLKLAPVIIASGSSILILGLYFVFRFSKWLFVPKLLLTVTGLILLDLSWYSKYMSLGPVLLFVFAFSALVLWVWSGKALIFMIIFYYLNIVVLFIIEYTSPFLSFGYPDLRVRTIDIYISFVLYSSLMVFILYRIKRDFLKQKELAIKSDTLKSAFLANMSHEVRTPMNAIIGFSELLEEEMDSATRQKYIGIIQNSGVNLLRLINDIIDLSRIEADDIEIKYSDFGICGLFDELKDIFALELIKRNKTDVQINYFLPDGDFIIHSDCLRLKQILSNLLYNSIKFTSAGSINFSCMKKSRELIFSISDTGIGISKENQRLVYTRFAKFDTNGLNKEGTGIGLAIAKKLLVLLQGKIWFDSTPGKGTSFYFSIPNLNPEN
jgi:signal transduction histidine kinase